MGIRFRDQSAIETYNPKTRVVSCRGCLPKAFYCTGGAASTIFIAKAVVQGKQW